MAALTTILLAAGLGLAATGTYMNYQGQQAQASAQRDALGQQQQIEAKRQQAMELDAQRRRRELIRQQLAARSQALSTATAQGASGEGSSALPGAYAGISGVTDNALVGTNQNEQIGNDIFGLHTGMLGSYRNAASASTMSALGTGLGSLGGTMMSNAGTIGRIGTFFGNSFSGGSGNASRDGMELNY